MAVTLAILIILTMLPSLEKFIDRLHQQYTYVVSWMRHQDAWPALEELSRKNKQGCKRETQGRANHADLAGGWPRPSARGFRVGVEGIGEY